MAWQKKKILVVDDEIRIRQIYIRMFVEVGLIVRWAADARSTIDILIREDIDLVLLDIKMPVIDGRTAFEIIHEYDPTIKVVIASVYPLDRQKQLVPHAHDYYDKSQGPLILLEKVVDALCDSAEKRGVL